MEIGTWVVSSGPMLGFFLELRGYIVYNRAIDQSDRKPMISFPPGSIAGAARGVI